ncbi:hypothetical protein TNCV_322761 [Trichonephila clavipes]|nr:hypothetical protein TNCV_322761 [Trichonephila clavipes]
MKSSVFDKLVALVAFCKVEYLVPLIVNKSSYGTTPLFSRNDSSPAPSGEILPQSQKRMKYTWWDIRTGVWCRLSQPRVAIWFCIVVTECVLALSSNNRTPDLKNPGRFFRLTSFNFDQGVTIPRRHCSTLVPTSKKSSQK